MIFHNSKYKSSKNTLFSEMCRNFQIKRKHQRDFRDWLLFNTTIDPSLLFLHKNSIQEIENWLKEKQEELKKNGAD